jgi:hypothetical protein
LLPLSLFGQAASFQTTVTNGQGMPLAGLTPHVCQGLATTAASINANTVTLTMSSNPLTAGFIPGSQIAIYSFLGGDAIFNSTLSNGILSTYTILTVNATQITYALIHNPYAATSNGFVVQQGISSCLPLATTYTDATGSNVFAGTYTTDGRGNFGFFATPGVYVIQYSGSSALTSLFEVNLACVPSSSISTCGALLGSNNTFTGNNTISNLNSVVYLDGVKYTTLATCYAAIPATGGTCVVPPNYSEALAASLTVNKSNSGFIFMGPATITMSSFQVIVPAATHGVFFYGMVPYGGGGFTTPGGAHFIYSGNSNAFQVGNGGGTTNRVFTWNNIHVQFSGATAPATGLYMTNVVYFDINNPSVAGENVAGTRGIVCDGTGNFCGIGSIKNPNLSALGTGILGTGSGTNAMNAVTIGAGTISSSVVGSIGLDIEVGGQNSVLSLDIESVTTAVKLGAGALGNNINFDDEAITNDVVALASSADNAVRVQTGGGSTPVVFSDAGTNNHIYRNIDGNFASLLVNGTPVATPTTTLKTGSGGGNYTSASTTYVVVDSTNLCYTATIPIGWKLGVQASGNIGTSTAVVAASFALTNTANCATANSGILVEGQAFSNAAGNTEPFSINTVIAGDGAVHNVALQFKTANGADSALILNSSGTLTPSMTFTLMSSN